MERLLHSLLIATASLAVLVSSSTAGVASSPEPPPAPGLGIRLLEAPTDRADDPRARVYVVDQVEPGATFTRRFEVSNGDDEPMDVLLYAAAASVGGGGFSIGARDDPGEVPQWTSVSPDRLRLEPGERAEVLASFAVPADAPSGEFYGGLVVERPAPVSSDGVGVALRAAIRVYLSVGTGAEPPSDFVVDTLTAQRDVSGRPVVLAQVRNTGGRALDMSGTLQLTEGPGGLSAGPFDATLGTTLGIGAQEPVSVVLDPALPNGPWTARLTLRSGQAERSVEGVLTFPEAAGEAAEPVEPVEVPLDARNPFVIVAGLLVGIVALLLVTAALLNRGPLRRRGAAGGGTPPAPAAE